jgi:hypothetical protein
MMSGRPVSPRSVESVYPGPADVRPGSVVEAGVRRDPAAAAGPVDVGRGPAAGAGPAGARPEPVVAVAPAGEPVVGAGAAGEPAAVPLDGSGRHG